MKIITVQKEGLIAELRSWGIADHYVGFFISKCDGDGRTVSLRPFAINETPQLNESAQWLRCCVGFWATAYRETEQKIEQIEAISAIRGLYYVAGLAGLESVARTIWIWWSSTYELHRLPSPNYSQGSVNHQADSSTLRQPFTTH